jgi:hypothetical protein
MSTERKRKFLEHSKRLLVDDNAIKKQTRDLLRGFASGAGQGSLDFSWLKHLTLDCGFLGKCLRYVR